MNNIMRWYLIKKCNLFFFLLFFMNKDIMNQKRHFKTYIGIIPSNSYSIYIRVVFIHIKNKKNIKSFVSYPPISFTTTRIRK